MMIRMALVMTMIGTTAMADSLSLSMPSGPQAYQSDKFRAGDLDCSNAIGSATNLEFGVTGILDGPDYNTDVTTIHNSSPDVGQVGVYARIVIPLGAKAKARINCNELYELELRKKRLEVMKLERELEALRALKFEE